MLRPLMVNRIPDNRQSSLIIAQQYGFVDLNMEVREQLHSGDAFSRGVRESDILCFHGGRSDGRLFPRGPEYGTIVNHDDDPRDRSPIVAIVSPVSVSINTGVQVGSSSECESKVFGVVQISEKMTRCFDVGNRGILVELR